MRKGLVISRTEDRVAAESTSWASSVTASRPQTRAGEQAELIHLLLRAARIARRTMTIQDCAFENGSVGACQLHARAKLSRIDRLDCRIDDDLNLFCQRPRHRIR